jgi:hypothetical protein
MKEDVPAQGDDTLVQATCIFQKSKIDVNSKAALKAVECAIQD